MPGTRIDIVTLGWELPGWIGAFYPEDLPPEWRLTYFSNEFPAVLIPARLWTGAGLAQLGAWAEDVHPDFRFYLEISPGADPGALGLGVPPLGGKLAGLVGKADVSRGLPAPLFRWQDDISVSEEGQCNAWSVPRPDMDVRAARVWLESLAQRLRGSPAVVVLDGGTFGAEDLRRWLQLAWMLGVA